MRFIVSPAKKMNVVDDAFGWRDLPMFADRAARLADTVRALSYDEAKALWQCSDAPVSYTHLVACPFSLKEHYIVRMWALRQDSYQQQTEALRLANPWRAHVYAKCKP